MEENRLWLQAQGVHVADNVDAFDLSGYLMTAGVRAEDVMLCIFNCAHGRNYRADSDERHGLMGDVGSWEIDGFLNMMFIIVQEGKCSF